MLTTVTRIPVKVEAIPSRETTVSNPAKYILHHPFLSDTERDAVPTGNLYPGTLFKSRKRLSDIQHKNAVYPI